MKKKKPISFSALAGVATLIASTAFAELLDNEQLSLDPTEQKEQLEVMIEVVFKPLEQKVPGIVSKMKNIADCESNIQHLLPDGSLKVNPDPDSSASGVFQVLLITHRPDYQRIDLDPRNAADNVKFARYMVERKLRSGRPPFEDWVCT